MEFILSVFIVLLELCLAARTESEFVLEFWLEFIWRFWVVLWSFSAVGVYLELCWSLFGVFLEFWFGCILGWSFVGVLLEFLWSFVGVVLEFPLVRACPGQEVCSPWKRTEVSLPGARGPGAGGLLPPRRHRKLVCPGHGPVGPGQEACSP